MKRDIFERLAYEDTFREWALGDSLLVQRAQDGKATNFRQFLELVRLFPHCFPASARAYFGHEVHLLLPPPTK